mmetsp:Transcript_402/g.795  ORF Transcript_402/g.795 Transcript_402/m.795 type:complete len:101 (+) Transcript_402:2478-2780(+)
MKKDDKWIEPWVKDCRPAQTLVLVTGSRALMATHTSSQIVEAPWWNLNVLNVGAELVVPIIPSPRAILSWQTSLVMVNRGLHGQEWDEQKPGLSNGAQVP